MWVIVWYEEENYLAKVKHKVKGSGGNEGKVKKKKKTLWKNRKNVTVKKPYFVERYNAYMKAVFKSDQMLFKYNLLLKCVRWWKTLVFHMIDISIVNSYVFFRGYQKSHP